MREQIGRHALRWLGHAARAQPGSLIKSLLHATAPASDPDTHSSQARRRGVTGGPVLTWNRAVREQVRGLQEEGRIKPGEGAWLDACRDKASWHAFTKVQKEKGESAI